MAHAGGVVGAHVAAIDHNGDLDGGDDVVGGPAPRDDNTARVLQAVVSCASRWGIAKTTVDDVAREAGLSRATVYRLFPGGKDAMVRRATEVEIAAGMVELRGRALRATDLEGALVELVRGGSEALEAHPALAYLRTHEPARAAVFVSFERLDLLLGAAADQLAPALERFLDEELARAAVRWGGRLVVSHFLNPDPQRALTDPVAARHLVRTYVLPGLVPDASHLHPNTHPATHPEHPIEEITT